LVISDDPSLAIKNGAFIYKGSCNILFFLAMQKIVDGELRMALKFSPLRKKTAWKSPHPQAMKPLMGSRMHAFVSLCGA